MWNEIMDWLSRVSNQRPSISWRDLTKARENYGNIIDAPRQYPDRNVFSNYGGGGMAPIAEAYPTQPDYQSLMARWQGGDY